MKRRTFLGILSTAPLLAASRARSEPATLDEQRRAVREQVARKYAAFSTCTWRNGIAFVREHPDDLRALSASLA